MEQLLTVEEAAKLLRLKPSTLHRHRWAGTGPAYAKLGSRVAYRPLDLEAWVNDRVRRSTSDPGQTA